jgi:hypothetical protein
MSMRVKGRNDAGSTDAFLSANAQGDREPISAPVFTSEAGERLRAERRESVRRLHERGLVPLAIADTLGWGDGRVARYLRELEDDGVITRPASWLTLHGPKRGVKCPTCSRIGFEP